MISQCSSANSVALYVPSLYVCVLAAERLQLHTIAHPFATGALLSFYTLPYLSLGVSQQWWQYAPAIEANSSSVEAATATAAALPLTGGTMWTLVGGVRSTALKPYQPLRSLSSSSGEQPARLPSLSPSLSIPPSSGGARVCAHALAIAHSRSQTNRIARAALPPVDRRQSESCASTL